MHIVSDAFHETIKRSHTKVSHAELVDHNYVVQYRFKVIDGNVNIDRNNLIRRSCRVTIADHTGDLNPNNASDLFHPLSHNRIRLYRGVVLPDGEEELIALGVFDMFDVKIDDTGESLTIDINGFDLSKAISRKRLLNNYVVPGGDTYDLAIRDLLSFVDPTLSFNMAGVPFISPPLVFGSNGDQGGGDPWKYATEMAESIGYEIYPDIVGVINWRPLPNYLSDPVIWEYTDDDPAGLLYTSKTFKIDETYNYVVVTGENTALDAPVRADAMDDNPNSSTYVYGPFGIVPTFMHSEYVTTVAQAQALANAKLQQTLCACESVQIITTANPAHDVGDVIKITRARTKIDTKYVIEKVNIGMSTNVSNNITLRKLRDWMV